MDGRTDLAEPAVEPVALAALLARVHAELVDLGRSADDLQALIGALAAARPESLDAEARMRLQAADALSQRLDRLARLAEVLGARAPDAWTLDTRGDGDFTTALARLGAGAGSAAEDPAEQGECELF